MGGGQGGSAADEAAWNEMKRENDQLKKELSEAQRQATIIHSLLSLFHSISPNYL